MMEWEQGRVELGTGLSRGIKESLQVCIFGSDTPHSPSDTTVPTSPYHIIHRIYGQQDQNRAFLRP